MLTPKKDQNAKKENENRRHHEWHCFDASPIQWTHLLLYNPHISETFVSEFACDERGHFPKCFLRHVYTLISWLPHIASVNVPIHRYIFYNIYDTCSLLNSTMTHILWQFVTRNQHGSFVSRLLRLPLHFLDSPAHAEHQFCCDNRTRIDRNWARNNLNRCLSWYTNASDMVSSCTEWRTRTRTRNEPTTILTGVCYGTQTHWHIPWNEGWKAD